MKQKKRIVLLSFYDKICLSNRVLSAKIKQAGHNVHLIFLKDDCMEIIDKLKENPIQYQILWLDQFWGCGQDVNIICDKEWNLLSSLIKKINPHIIGISSRSPHKHLANQTVKHLRKILPDCTYLAGGYGPTLEPEVYLQEFDFVCIGEGDEVIATFIEAEDKKRVPNIAYLLNNKITWNKILPSVNLEDLPFPDWDHDNKYFIENNEILTGDSFYDSKTYDIFCSRGCPAACTYCMACQWNYMLKPFKANFLKIRLRTPESVIKELLWAKEKFNIKYIRFRDDIFGFNEKWLFEIMDLYDKNIGLEFNCLLDERYMNERKIKRLYQSGLRKTTVGIQSADENIRRKVLNRQISDDRVIAYAEMVRSLGIQIKYDLVGWNPFENHETLRNGMNFLKRMPKYADTCVFELKMFPGSPILKKFQEEKPTPLSIDEYTYWSVLHQMVLFSESTQEKAFSLVENPDYNAKKVLSIFREESRRKKVKGQKLIAVTDIDKGCRIMNDRFSLVKSDEPGINDFEYIKLRGMTANVFIKKGTILKWDYFYHSYEDIRGRNTGKSR